MDNYNSQSPYNYGGSYGYPHVPPPNQAYPPPPNPGGYPSGPPPNSQYPYPQNPQYPPQFAHSSSGHLNYQGYATPSAPVAPPVEHRNYHHPPHSGPLAYPQHGYQPPPPSAPQPNLQHYGSFQYGPSYYQHQYSGHFQPPPESTGNAPPRVENLSSQHHHGGPPSNYDHFKENPSIYASTNHDHGKDNAPIYPPAYPPIEDQLAHMSLAGDRPSAPASPPAPAAFSVSSIPPQYSHSGPLPMTSKLHGQGTMYAYPNNSFSSFETSSMGKFETQSHLSSQQSFTYPDSPHNHSMSIMPYSPGKGSKKVFLLHGDLDIWIYEAKNLPNMDMFHKTIGDMFNKLPGNVTTKIEGHMNNKITSDPYVTVVVSGATVGRTYVISNNENPLWMQQFNIPVAHHAADIQFVVKDNDVVGSQLIGTVSVPVENLYAGGKLEGSFPILGANGKPCKAGAMLSLSVKYIPIDKMSVYQLGVGAGPEYNGVPGTYFPLRRGGSVTLYQDAHVPDGLLPNFMLENGMQYVHGKCWHDIFDAIRRARRLIYITGWSVWHKVRLVRDDIVAGDCTLGELLKSKSQEGVRVLLLVWDDPTSRNILGYKTDGVMATHDEETRRFFKHSSVQVLLCPRSAGKRHSWMKQREVGVIYTHHQKTIIVDADAGNNRRKIVAFVGGLDLCDGRYDTPEHPIFRTLQTVHADDYHNPTYTGSSAGCPREPWHDLHSKIDGPAAYDVLTNFEERWLKAAKPQGIKKLKTSYDDALLRIERMADILGMQDVPFVNDSDPEGWHVQIFRSIDSNSVKGFPKDPKEAILKNLACGKNQLIDMSIHTAYVKAIRSAQHYIYIENQYFIGSSYNWGSNKDLGANNLIPMEIALKIADKIRAHERFAAYIIVPMWPEGNPTGAATQRILFWQNKTMQMMYETIYKALLEVGLESAFSPQDYLNFYCLGNREAVGVGEKIDIDSQTPANSPQALGRKNRRFMIYVHSKGMIVDDEYVILGSANINQRSLEGNRDTEIAMGAYQPQYTFARKGYYPHGQVYGYRMSLWAEHLGVVEDCFATPETLECVRRVRAMGEMNWQQFAHSEVSEMRGHLLKYPVEVDRKGKVRPLPGSETFPDVGGQIVGSFLAIQENLTI
ncbi:phospholipase [Lithospermum erythrorhizon]|uniref:Phospholipase D alpha 1 n=1 Tax=Lithospermum erythrorhizon TaxID=34254 RepID=A0AAV3PSC6_LITER